ncbi:single-stranded DNA-binding protein [Seonamhaeicola sp.]|uniref:single-stranded DNA-binding protein n=1 Tax=Seonamhaeicola sp. TaxID=1912245 RepID=UPI003568212D
MSLNKVQLIGFLGDDVKLHHFDGGGVIGRFSLATNETYIKKENNEKVTDTEWHNIVVRNKQAETLEKYIKKGDQIYVEGKIKTRKWQDKDGVDKYSTEIHVFNFTFLSTKSNGAENQPKPQQQQAYNKAGDEFLNSKNEDDDLDLPF